MRFSVVLPNTVQIAALTQPWECGLTGSDIAGVTHTAERLGFTRVFIPEHFVIPTTHSEPSGNHYFDATTAQAYIADATSTISIGSMVTILPCITRSSPRSRSRRWTGFSVAERR